ncbi:MAG: GNAT family N-acetyltransferase [Dongiaceae bacterium]
MHKTAPPPIRHPRFPPLQTERLSLRILRLSDAPLIYHTMNQRNVAESLAEVPYPYPLGAAEEFIKYTHEALSRQDRVDLAIERREDRKFLGVIGFRKAAKHDSNVGYWIIPEYWGQGYASEALQRITQYAFEIAKMKKLEGSALADNLPSRRVLEKAGFVFKDFYLKNFPARGRLVRLANYIYEPNK